MVALKAPEGKNFPNPFSLFPIPCLLQSDFNIHHVCISQPNYSLCITPPGILDCTCPDDFLTYKTFLFQSNYCVEAVRLGFEHMNDV